MQRILAISLMFLVMLLLALTSTNVHAENYITIDGPASQVPISNGERIGHQNTIYWSYPTIDWYVNENAGGDTLSAITAAYSEWAGVATSNVSFDYQGMTPNTWGVDGMNVIHWADSGSNVFDYLESYELSMGYAITIITVNSLNQMTDVDIIFDGRRTWKTDGNAPDIQAIATHEIGHMIGLHHTDIGPPNPTPTMWWGYHVDEPTEWQDLTLDDEAGTSFLYGGNIIRNTNLYHQDTYFYWNINVLAGVSFNLYPAYNIYMADNKEINVYGTLTLNNETITTMPGGSNWDGVDVNSTGVLHCTGDSEIKNSKRGLEIWNSSGLNVDSGDNLTISDPEDYGVYVWSCSPDINGVFVDNVTDTNSYLAGIEINGASASPDLENVTIEDCPRGISVIGSGFADVGKSHFEYNAEETIYLGASAGVLLGMYDCPGVGYNNIITDYGEYTIKQYDSSADHVYADFNYWENISFSHPGNVTINTYESEQDAGHTYWKPALGNSDVSLLSQGLRLEDEQHWDEAIECYTEFINQTSNQQQIRQAIRYMLRVKDHSDKNYAELKKIINNILPTLDDSFKPSVEYILCDIGVREGKYEDAISAFLDAAETYKGTSHEVDMLSRIAMIYGNDLRDKDMAREYASKAALINPGQPVLQGAFSAADIEYEPYQFTDRSRDLDYPSEPLLPEEDTETIAEFIGNSPNPFNPATTFTFAIGDAGHVTLDVYSIAGQKVATLVDDSLAAGTHSAVFDGSSLGSGMYFYRFHSPGLTKTGKMLLVK